jgi:hypothetical protein
LSLANCNSKNKSPKNDLGKMNLKGDVIGVLDDDNFTFFNKDGNIEKIINISNNEALRIEKYLYSDGKLNKIVKELKSANLNDVRNCSYDENNHLISIIQAGDALAFSNNYFTYNNDGLLIKDSIVLMGGEYGNPKFSEFTIVNYYYKDGIIDLEEVIYEGKVKKIKYSNGIMTENVLSDGSKLTFESNIDSHGNWTIQKCIQDGSINKRIIFYNGEDISKYEKLANDFKQGNNSVNSAIESQQNLPTNNSNNTTQSQSTQNQVKTCYKCQGSGSLSCDQCAGRGETRCSSCTGNGFDSKGNKCIWCKGGFKECTRCHGSGKISCMTCHGLGHL